MRLAVQFVAPNAAPTRTADMTRQMAESRSNLYVLDEPSDAAPLGGPITASEVQNTRPRCWEPCECIRPLLPPAHLPSTQ